MAVTLRVFSFGDFGCGLWFCADLSHQKQLRCSVEWCQPQRLHGQVALRPRAITTVGAASVRMARFGTTLLWWRSSRAAAAMSTAEGTCSGCRSTARALALAWRRRLCQGGEAAARMAAKDRGLLCS